MPICEPRVSINDIKKLCKKIFINIGGLHISIYLYINSFLYTQWLNSVSNYNQTLSGSEHLLLSSLSHRYNTNIFSWTIHSIPIIFFLIIVVWFFRNVADFLQFLNNYVQIPRSKKCLPILKSLPISKFETFWRKATGFTHIPFLCIFFLAQGIFFI